MADIKISQLGEALAVTDNDILPMTASGVTSKVKASTMKSYMVDDLDVSDLHDTTITTPTDDDGLVYDATAQKWENKQITTKEQWKKNGAYNLQPIDIATQVLNAVTITVNSDGIKTQGAPSSVTYIRIASKIFGAGKYRLCGCPIGGTYGTYCQVFRVYNGTSTSDTYTDYQETGSGVDVTLTGNQLIESWIFLWSGAGGYDGTLKQFKPMITTDLNATYSDYQPYAKTNRELTELTGALASGYGNVAFQKAGREVIVNGFFNITGDIATNTNVMQIPSGYSPIQNMFVMVNRISDGITRGLVANSSAGYIKTGDQTLPTGYWSIVGTWFV